MWQQKHVQRSQNLGVEVCVRRGGIEFTNYINNKSPNEEEKVYLMFLVFSLRISDPSLSLVFDCSQRTPETPGGFPITADDI